jgi:hypothetical protein
MGDTPVTVQLVPFVGGPKDGDVYTRTAARFVVVPDASDRLSFVDAEGHIATRFGEHTYEMNCYARGEERRYQLDYVGYRKPVLPHGASVVGDVSIPFTWQPRERR